MNLGKVDCKGCEFSGLPCEKHCLSTIHYPCGHSAEAEGLKAAHILRNSPCFVCVVDIQPRK